MAPNGQSLFWDGLNKGKKSIAVDMKSPEGQRADHADHHGAGRGCGPLHHQPAGARLARSCQTCRGIAADLIMVTLTGDRHGQPQVDYTVNPALGIPHMTGPVDGGPSVAHALPAWDVAAGKWWSRRCSRRNATGCARVGAGCRILAQGCGGGHDRASRHDRRGSADRQPRATSGNALYRRLWAGFPLFSDGKRVMVIGLTDRQWAGGRACHRHGEAMARARGRDRCEDLDDEGARWTAPRHHGDPHAVVRGADAASRLRNLACDRAGVTWSQFRSCARGAGATIRTFSEDNPMFSLLDHPGVGRILFPARR